MYLYMCPRLKRVSNCRLQTSADGDAYPEHRSRNMVVHCWQTCRLPGLSRSACIQHYLLRIWILPYTPINPAMMSGWFWSQNILFLHLPQKINHTGIESFPTFVLFLELVTCLPFWDKAWRQQSVRVPLWLSLRHLEGAQMFRIGIGGRRRAVCTMED